MHLKFWGMVALLMLPLQSKAMGYSSDYLSCINSAGSELANVAQCMKAEFNYQDKRVDKNFDASLALYGDKEKKKQKAFQKNWVKLRDSNCDKKTSTASTAHQTRYLNCALKMTLSRADLLEKQLYRLK